MTSLISVLKSHLKIHSVNLSAQFAKRHFLVYSLISVKRDMGYALIARSLSMEIHDLFVTPFCPIQCQINSGACII